jgi:signal transduction histidine kinase
MGTAPIAENAIPLQPNLTRILQVFAAVRVLFAVVFFATAGSAANRLLLTAAVPIITSIAVLLFACSGTLRRRLGAAHIQLALFFATLDTLLVTRLYMRWSASIPLAPFVVSPAQSSSARVEALQILLNDSTVPLSPLLVMISLFGLIIVISWQFKLRVAIGYIIITTVVDIVIMLLTSANVVLAMFHMAVILVRVVQMVILAVVINYLVNIQNRQNSSLREANTKLVRYVGIMEELTISQERNRLARELHDTLAHTLSAASVQLEAANSLWQSDRDKSHTALTQAMTITRDGLSETRRALKALRASPLDDLGFILAIKELGEQLRQRTRAQVSISIAPNLGPIHAEIEQSLYRATQEAFENIVRHANAKHVKVTLAQHDTVLRMTIADDGTGFDVSAARNNPERFGLNGMIERIEALNGHVNITSQPRQGTHISMEMTL